MLPSSDEFCLSAKRIINKLSGAEDLQLTCAVQKLPCLPPLA